MCRCAVALPRASHDSELVVDVQIGPSALQKVRSADSLVGKQRRNLVDPAGIRVANKAMIIITAVVFTANTEFGVERG